VAESEELRHLEQLLEQEIFSEVLHEAERLEKKYTETGRHQQLADVLIAKVKALWALGRLEESLKAIKQCEHVLTFLEQPKEVKKREAHLVRHRGNICLVKHDLKRSLKYYQQSLAISEEIGYKEGILLSLSNITDIYIDLGDLRLALKYGNQVKTLSEEIGAKNRIVNSLLCLGYTYFVMNDLDQAKNLFHQGLALAKKYNYINLTAEAYRHLGNLSWELGDPKQALDHFEQSYFLYQKSGFKFYLLETLFRWFSLTIEMNSLEQAQHLFQRLQQLDEQEGSAMARPFHLLAKAMLLKTSPRLRDKAEAQNILLELVEEEYSIFIKITAMLNLCESFLDELKTYEDHTVFQEALTIAQQVYSLAQHVRLFSFTIKLLLLKAKFATVEGDLTAAMDFLEQAKTSAEDKGLGSLAARAETEKKQLETQFNEWQQLIQGNVPFKVRLEKSNLENYISEAKRMIEMPDFDK